MADHLRPWKQVQREFQLVEREKLEKSKNKTSWKSRRSKYQKQIDEIDAKIQAGGGRGRNRGARDPQDRRGAQVAGGKDRGRRHAAAIPEGRSRQQAQLLRRHDRIAATNRRRGRTSNTVVLQAEQELESLSLELERVKKDLAAKKAEKEEKLGFVDDLKKKKERLTREADRVARVIEQKDALYGGPAHWY